MFMILATLMAGAVWLVGDIKLWNCHDHHLDSCGSQQPACTGLDVCITQISGSDWNNKEQKYLLDCMCIIACLATSLQQLDGRFSDDMIFERIFDFVQIYMWVYTYVQSRHGCPG